ncbi:hypothetical protein LINPERPRIM_LOCUS21803 [Linum perenne]
MGRSWQSTRSVQCGTQLGGGALLWIGMT